MTIFTRDVHQAFDTTTPKRSSEVAAEMGVRVQQISGHVTYLHRVGKLQRLARGRYLRIDFDTPEDA